MPRRNGPLRTFLRPQQDPQFDGAGVTFQGPQNWYKPSGSRSPRNEYIQSLMSVPPEAPYMQQGPPIPTQAGPSDIDLAMMLANQGSGDAQGGGDPLAGALTGPQQAPAPPQAATQRQGIRIPQGPPSHVPLPRRPQQSAWDVLPQLLAGAGDVFAAGSGGRGGNLDRVMGLQGGLRDQRYGDQIREMGHAFEGEQAQYEHGMRMMDFEARERQRAHGRGYKDMEAEMLRQMFQKKQEEAVGAEESGRRLQMLQGKALFAEADTPERAEEIYQQQLATISDPKQAEILNEIYSEHIRNLEENESVYERALPSFSRRSDDEFVEGLLHQPTGGSLFDLQRGMAFPKYLYNKAFGDRARAREHSEGMEENRRRDALIQASNDAARKRRGGPLRSGLQRGLK